MNPSNAQVPPDGQPGGASFSLVELLIAVTILGALIAIAVPWFEGYREQARISSAIGDLRTLDNQLKSFRMSNDFFPPALNAVPQGTLLDPWGNNYQYLAIENNVKAKGNERMDKNLVPINSDFDLYSMGKDGASKMPLTAKDSLDDIVRANDGRYFGLASKY